MWRHGDVLIARIPAIPDEAKRKPGSVLMHGELTGHSHRLEDPACGELLELRGTLFLRIHSETARVIHQEHLPIVLPQGNYRVWQQREYSPEAILRVRD